MSKKIAVLITDEFEDSEFTSPAQEFRQAGHEVITIEKQAGKTIHGKQGEAEVVIEKPLMRCGQRILTPCCYRVATHPIIARRRPVCYLHPRFYQQR